MHLTPGELHALLERCRADDSAAWDRLAGWVTTRGRAILGGVNRLSDADGEDAVAETLKSLITIVRRGEIRGTSNAEIDAYVCTAIRRHALNVLRGRARRREVDSITDMPVAETPGDTSSQDTRASAAEQLDRVDALLRSWPAEDRFLFIAKIDGVSAGLIRKTLEQPPFGHFIALATIDTRFHRLRQRLKHLLASAESEAAELRTYVTSCRALRTRLSGLVAAAIDEMPVLIAGEHGTGKRMVAREIHARSRRATGPFVEVSCTATPTARLQENLRRLFGTAAGGTLLLGEVDALSLAMQAAVLRLIDTPPREVRVIVATHVDLHDAVRRRALSADLLGRFARSTVMLPTLRERPDDIVLLARHFADRVARRHGGVLQLTRGAEARLSDYRWPGNVRELAEVIERAARRRKRDEIGVEALQLPRA